MKKHDRDDRYEDERYPENDDWDDDPDSDEDWDDEPDEDDEWDDPEEYEPDGRFRAERRPAAGRFRRRKRGGWLKRKLIGLAVPAVLIALVIVFFPFIRMWVMKLLPRFDYARASQILSATMEEKGDYVADEVTLEGVLYGTQSVDFIVKIPYLSVEADYIYKAQIGVKLSEVRLTPLEDGIRVTVPDMTVLYDSITIKGEPRYDDFWSMQSNANFQKLVSDQRADCNQTVSQDREKMAKAWDHTCSQLNDWFDQWIGEELSLTFVHPSDEPEEAVSPATATPLPDAVP